MTVKMAKKYKWVIAATAATLISIYIALVGCDRSGTTTQSVATAPIEYKGNAPELADDSIGDIAAEFRNLRAIKGHFEGGTWSDDVDKWRGRKHQLMIQLESRLSTGEYSKTEIIQLLAPPDVIARQGDNLFDLVNSLPEFEGPTTAPYEFLIYYWRGTHDFLFFTAQDDTIIRSGWWYAGD